MRDKPADGETVAGPQSGSVATLLLVWSVTLAELRRNPPASLTELQATVKEFARGCSRMTSGARRGTSVGLGGPKSASAKTALAPKADSMRVSITVTK